MAFKTFPFQEKCSKNKKTDHRKKLQRLKSVKLVNLDRLRSSMKRNQTLQTSSYDACSSEQSSTPVSGTSSPHYMKATTSSSARKGSAAVVPASTRATARKKRTGSRTGLVSVECCDPAGVDVPVEIEPGKMSSVRQTRKVSRVNSMRIRARYSQFSEGGCSDQAPVFGEGMKEKGVVERSRSIKLTRLKSIRSSKRRLKSRLGSEMSGSQPRYMKDTSSQQARKNSAKGLTRTSSLRPLRILAKIPSLRPRRSRPKSVARATCSSTLKSSKMPDHVELEPEGISAYHVCPYSYCSLNAHHHHHGPAMPIRKFISERRRTVNSHKGKQLEGRSNASGNVGLESDLVMEEDGVDYVIRIYAKPRKKWSIEADSSEDSEVLNCSVHDHNYVGEGDWEQEEIQCETSSPEARQKRLSDGQPESYQMFSLDDETKRWNSESIESNSTLELPDSGEFLSRDSESGGENSLIDILSDNQKYSSIWNLIYQQLVSSGSSMVGNPRVGGVGERERDEEANNGQDMTDSDLIQRKYNDLGEDQDEFDQSDVINMVHDAVNAILQRDEQSPDLQQSFADHGMSTPVDFSEEKLRESGEAVSEQKSETNDEMTVGRKPSKSISRFRKIIATTRFINAMERMRKISPRPPRFLSPESTIEEERVYLRHLSMKGRKNNEEWLLDYALQKVISRLSPDEQKRVARLVEAFETVKSYPSDEQVPIQMHDGGDSGSNATGEKDSRACDKIDDSDSIDAVLEESHMEKEETTATLEVRPQLPSQDPEVGVSGDTNTFLVDERKYRNMWALIYQQVRSDATSVNTEKGVDECNERKQRGQEMKDPGSTDEDDRSSVGEKPELNQSAAIKLVREAIDAILQRYEQSSNQQFRSYKDRAIGDDRSHDTLASGWNTGDHPVEDGLKSDPEFHQMEKQNEELQRQVESDGSKTPQKKISKLKKAVVTAKFIKAMERLRKITPQKPRHLNQEAASGEERVYLRHLSMGGRKNEEEWMLDYALRQVISKLAPDQQRRVEWLVEAFETVTPEQKDGNNRFDPSKRELTPGNGLSSTAKQSPSQLVAKLRGRSVSNEVTEKDDDKDHEERAAVSHSTLELSEDDPISAYVGEAVQEAKAKHEVDTSEVITSQTVQDSESGTAGDMISILSDKGKYNIMWQLIYQHVRLNKTLVSSEEVVSEVDENEYDDEKKGQSTDGPESLQSNQSEACDEKELGQSAAIKLVKEAISAILQSHEQIPNRQPSASTEKDCRSEKTSEMDVISEEEYEICTVQKAGVATLEQVQSVEVKTSKQSVPKSTSKLKKLIMTTKFIKAMERLRRTSPRSWSPETVSEGERVKLRPQTTNQKRSSEEWMLDYALRKVISNLAPDQQKKVARLIGAFEAVTPEKQGQGTGQIEFSTAPAASIASDRQIVELEQKDSTSCKALVPSKHEQPDQPEETLIKERGLREDHPNEIWNSEIEPHENAFDSEVIPKVKTKEETDSNLMIESLQHSYSNKVSKEESGTDAEDGLLSGTKKHNTMWHLIYQHLGSVAAAETGNKQGERVANEDHMIPSGTSSESIDDADNDDDDADNDDNDTSSVGSELTERDAVMLLKGAIVNIIDRPRDVDAESFSNNTMHVSKEDQREEKSVEEEPEKRLTRAHSKLRKLIVCNKFIRAMEKGRKSHPRKDKKLALDTDGAAEKARLKSSAIGEKKYSDAWMLDHVLQKAIAELKPVQQKRVAMLVKAFEKVNPELEGMNDGSCCNRTESADGDVSASKDEEKEDSTFEPSDKLGEMKDGCDMTTVVSDGCEDIQETPHSDTEVVAKLSQPEYVEDAWNGGAETSTSSDKERYSSLWGLLVKHINSDVSENSEKEKALEINVNADMDKGNMLAPENADNSQQHSDEDDKGDDMEGQTPKSVSFEFQEQEAIKLVQEALHDILLPESPGDDQLMKTSEISVRDEVKDTSMIPQEDESSAKESSPDISSKLSKVILCKRFVKAMDKMRKLKQQIPANHVQQHHSNAESMKRTHHITSSDKKSWEEWMLDHAMQQVVGKLAPVQKKKVSLLVQAFETVSSQPEPGTIRSKTARSPHIKTGKEH